MKKKKKKKNSSKFALKARSELASLEFEVVGGVRACALFAHCVEHAHGRLEALLAALEHVQAEHAHGQVVQRAHNVHVVVGVVEAETHA